MDQNEYHCSDCGAEVSMGSNFCMKCGAKLEWDAPRPKIAEKTDGTCSECGSPVSVYNAVCPVCGTRLRNQKPDPPPLPMALGDIISRTVQLIGRSFLRYVPIALIVFIPASVLFTFGLRDFYSSLENPSGHIGIALLGFAGIVVAIISVSIAVTRIVRGEIYGLPCSWQDALRSAFSVYLRRAFGQAAIIGLSFVCTIFILVFVSVMMLGDVHSPLLVGLAVIVAYFAAIFLFIRLVFSLTAMVCEEAGPFRSMRRSWDLVKGTWWRVFGIMLLMGMLSGFAITIVTTPLAFIALWDFYREVFKTLATGGGTHAPAIPPDAYKSFGLGMGISTSINMTLSSLVTPIYITLLYYDLRARAGEFETPQPVLLSEADKPQPSEPAPPEGTA